jgi:hypothetical protein
MDTSTSAPDTNAAAAANAPAPASAYPQPSADSQPGHANKMNPPSDAATNVTSPSMDSSATTASKATTAKRAAGANADQTKVASATPRSNSRAQGRTASNPSDTAYRTELRNCVQKSGNDRESCLDQAIQNHGRTQSG